MNYLGKKFDLGYVMFYKLHHNYSITQLTV